MKTLPLVLRILAIVAAIVSTTLFFMAKGKLSEKQAQLDETRQTLQTTEEELTTARADISQLEDRLRAESAALADAKRELEGVRAEMYTARQELGRTRKKLKQSRSEVTELEETTRELRNDLLESEEKLAQAEADGDQLSTMQARVRELEAARDNLKTELEAAKNRSTTAQMIEQTGGSAAPAGSVAKSFQSPDSLSRLSAETEVKSISTENGLIVLRADPEMELAAGQKISLISNLQALATVEITEVKDSLALANILPGGRTSSLERGSRIQLFR